MYLIAETLYPANAGDVRIRRIKIDNLERAFDLMELIAKERTELFGVKFLVSDDLVDVEGGAFYDSTIITVYRAFEDSILTAVASLRLDIGD